jgi:hypothetical protein
MWLRVILFVHIRLFRSIQTPETPLPAPSRRYHCAGFRRRDGPGSANLQALVAQRIEQQTSNLSVAGSNPAGRTSNVVGRQPSGSCASRRTTVPRATPSPPQRRHHRSTSPASAPSPAGTTRQARTARSGSIRWPTTSNPSSSTRVNVLRSGRTKVASDTSRSSGWAV